MPELEEKIRNKSAKVGIVGLGYEEDYSWALFIAHLVHQALYRGLLKQDKGVLPVDDEKVFVMGKVKRYLNELTSITIH